MWKAARVMPAFANVHCEGCGSGALLWATKFLVAIRRFDNKTQITTRWQWSKASGIKRAKKIVECDGFPIACMHVGAC